MTAPGEAFDAEVIIIWPAPRGGALTGALTEIRDAATGEMITAVRSAGLQVRLDAEDVIRADAQVLCDPDGNLLRPGLICYPDPEGGPLTRAARLLVTEMRVAAP